MDRIKRARQNIEQNTDIRGSIVTEKVNDYTSELQSIKNKAISDGTFMKVKNPKTGKLVKSNLNEKQWLQVRTKAFKDWFGDWENNPSEASKVIDENGEPLVLYHGTSKEFNTFNISGGDFGGYFTSDKNYAINIAKKQSSNRVLEVFVNARNLKTTETPLVKGRIDELYWEDVFNGDQVPDAIKGHDLLTNEVNFRSEGTEYVVFDPNNIKSATSNDGSFSNTNADIRYSSVTEQPTPQPSVLDFMSRLPIEEQREFATSLYAGEINGSCM